MPHCGPDQQSPQCCCSMSCPVSISCCSAALYTGCASPAAMLMQRTSLCPGAQLIDMGEHMLRDYLGTHNLLQVLVPGLEDRCAWHQLAPSCAAHAV